MIISMIGSYINQSEYSRLYICEYMKISQNTLSNWSNGKTYPSIPQLFKLADLLGVEYGDFYKWKGDKN